MVRFRNSVADGRFGLRYRSGMDAGFLLDNWALVAAALVLTVVLLFVGNRLWARSGRGQLTARRRSLRQRRADMRRAEVLLAKRERRVEKLRARASSVKPRLISEAKEAVRDAEALLKIAQDQVLIAENHLRKVILEEFPPRRHEALRRKYLPPAGTDRRPFSF